MILKPNSSVPSAASPEYMILILFSSVNGALKPANTITTETTASSRKMMKSR